MGDWNENGGKDNQSDNAARGTECCTPSTPHVPHKTAANVV